MKIMQLTTRKILIFIISLVVVPLLANAAAGITLAPEPGNIEMGAQYNGLTLKVNGTIPAGSQLALRFTGAPTELHLREKGKVMGLLWMNVGQITVKNVPRVCIVDTSKTIAELGEGAKPFGLEGVMKSIEVEEDTGGNQNIDVEKELLNLKKEEGLFSETSQGITLGPDQGATRSFTAELAIPSALAPGSYRIEAVALNDGRIVATGETSMTAELIGFPAWLSKLALEKSLLYGVMATLIAIFSGLAIGLVFQSKGAH